MDWGSVFRSLLDFLSERLFGEMDKELESFIENNVPSVLGIQLLIRPYA